MQAPVFRLGLWALLLLSGCALQFNDPEADLRNKIRDPYPISFPILLGRWEADSTYTTDDLNARGLKGAGLTLDLYPDSTFTLHDTGWLVFDLPGHGRFDWAANALNFNPDSATVFTATLELTFLGNYLQLYLPAKRRYAAFHRVESPDTLQMAGWLRGNRWQLTAKRMGSNLPFPESLNTRFESVIFTGDSFHWESNNHGLVTHQRGTFIATDSTLTLSGGGSTSTWLPQWIATDSLRLWPLHSGKPDSGFSIFTRSSTRHPSDLDVSFLTRYWRCDSVWANGQWRELHFGDFYDLGLDTVHRILRWTNSTSLPAFLNWDIDSGRVMLGESGKTSGYSVTHSGNRITLRSLSTVPSERFDFRLTAIDSSGLRSNPLNRFPASPYARVAVGTDTLPYYWKTNFFRWPSYPDKFEIYGVFGSDTLSLIAQLPTGSLTFSSSMNNFRFGVSGRTGPLGRFTCFADTSAAFAFRLSSVTDPNLWPGTFQGSCKIRSADNPGSVASDSLLALSGDFRFRLFGNPPMASPLWAP